MVSVENLRAIANVLRVDSLKSTSAAGSGHPTSCMSCAEIMACLFFNEMSWDTKNAKNPDNDEFILSKGHAAPILYSALYRAKAIKNDLMHLRKLHSPLEGHPMPRSLNWAKVGTGSLGQGLSVGIGMALAARMQGRKYTTFVLMGDSEIAEGSVYEAAELASYYKMDNLVGIVDVNRLGQRGETLVGHNVRKYAQRFHAFGWNVITIDGHDVQEVLGALRDARETIGGPTMILAKTFKGKGVSFMENKEGWHGRVANTGELKRALAEIGKVRMPRGGIKRPVAVRVESKKAVSIGEPNYHIGQEVATRDAYGEVLAKLALADPKLVAVDAEVSNSTKSESVKSVAPEKFIETFISEQNMAGICLGLSVKGMNVYGSTFAAFLTRTHDQIRMAALSSANLTFCGSHVGVSIGEDGGSQMGLEDISMFRALPGSSVFYPSDAVSAEKLTATCEKLKGLKYIRTTRGKTPVIYDNSEKFKPGDFKVLRESAHDRIVLAGAGITLHECLKVQKILDSKGVSCAVVDLYCLKPFDSAKFLKFAKEHGGRVIVVEDHRPEGGIGEMIMGVLSGSNVKVKHLAVREIPHSGKPAELANKYGIDVVGIVGAVRRILV